MYAVIPKGATTKLLAAAVEGAPSPRSAKLTLYRNSPMPWKPEVTSRWAAALEKGPESHLSQASSLSVRPATATKTSCWVSLQARRCS
ncbi:hypothetical protein IscW_ISCW009168 [Ixodes scapularis]|uniref:Uncharacterized protein n=1 Tax=Ixodes scapularis TaxID=6945 RepID=B7Q1A9_IXOSC|nr:hypothetical protein IscW_ISCW009168 [Ixodes scapularis]|eukprot:XP_002409237.1 hypothetical protein IscW_ISCW009168 [Ixodes scapularis]